MTGLLRPFVRKMRVEKQKDGWYVMKKYHGYWYEEHGFPLSTKRDAEAAMASMRAKEEKMRAQGIW